MCLSCCELHTSEGGCFQLIELKGIGPADSERAVWVCRKSHSDYSDPSVRFATMWGRFSHDRL
ncbi:hypothetical protein ADIMK_2148 [Marinobacterium lacunae]|uniref:Uncharacterized protein n=1 Tax=Marinobacterium lacunae TaxID=1232683 RepID=A0A081FYT7_9GAMM|nr:hypothetical protein ADIMK_2148 [Marinobacterium lacunae]